MAEDLPFTTLWRFVTEDFEAAWNALARVPPEGTGARGGFMFARQAFTAFELALRLCESDESGTALGLLATSIGAREPRYFRRLPGRCERLSSEFRLPAPAGADAEFTLLAAMWDMVRHGQAHQYQQIRTRLTDGRDFQFCLTGAQSGSELERPLNRRGDHLLPTRGENGDIYVKVRTDALYLDIRDSVLEAGLLGRPDLQLRHLERPRPRRNPRYSYDSTALAEALGL